MAREVTINGIRVRKPTSKEYAAMRDHCVCYCTHKRKNHNPDRSCVNYRCECKGYATRVSWPRGRKPNDDTALFLSMDDDHTAQEHYACMYFDDAAEVPESCQEPAEQIGMIEIPLWVVDVTWRPDVTTTQSYANMKVAPAVHPLERGCFTTMPLVLCNAHRRQLTCV